MKFLNNPYVALLTLLGFIAIVQASLTQEGYAANDVAAMDNLVASVSAPQTNAEKMVYLYGGD